MKKLMTVLFIGLLMSHPSSSLVAAENANHNGGLLSLRGAAQLADEKVAEPLKRVQRDQATIPRDYLHQPPLLPHQIRNYQVNTQTNKCMSCHSWNNHRRAGATKVSMSHFDTRDGKQLSSVSPRRYFCSQCHVTQADARPLIANEFKPVDELSKQ